MSPQKRTLQEKGLPLNSSLNVASQIYKKFTKYTSETFQN